MRELKFRAWDISGSRKMSPIFGLNCQELWAWCDKNKFECELDGEIMQFTGLHDRDGKEIYEGDIIEYENYITCEVHTDIIEWKECTCFVGECTLYDVCIYPHKDIEVIGNIYEHKHLLKK